jgi:hypothetical protein
LFKRLGVLSCNFQPPDETVSHTLLPPFEKVDWIIIAFLHVLEDEKMCEDLYNPIEEVV